MLLLFYPPTMFKVFKVTFAKIVDVLRAPKGELLDVPGDLPFIGRGFPRLSHATVLDRLASLSADLSKHLASESGAGKRQPSSGLGKLCADHPAAYEQLKGMHPGMLLYFGTDKRRLKVSRRCSCPCRYFLSLR